MFKYFKKHWAVIFIFLVWFIFSSPYFLQGKVPYSSTYQVNFFPPWSSYDQFHGPVKNNAMPDITDQIYPWRHFTIETWKKNQIPLWNPNSFSGNPHLANYQSAVLSPLNLLFFIFPFVDAWSINVLLAPLAAGFFAYLFLRELKVSKTGSVISAVSFMFCGFMVVWAAYGTLSWAIAFLPLSLFAIERWTSRKDRFSSFLLLISIPFSFFSGHFQTSIYFFLLTISFLIFKLLQSTKKSGLLILVFLGGTAISLLQIIPSIQLYFESVRSGLFITQPGIPLYYLINLFAPDFFGNPVTRNDWFGYYAEWASFIGIVPLMLSVFSFDKKNKYGLFFFIVSLVALFFALDSPLQQVITSLKIPVISTSNPTRIIVIFSFGLIVLSGFGFDKFIELLRNKNFKKINVTLFLFSIFFAAMLFSIFFLNPLPKDKTLIAQRNIIIPVAIFSSFLVLTLISRFKNKNFTYLIIFLVAFDSLRFAQKWMPFDPKNLVFPDTPVISGIKENIGEGRIFGNFLANIDTFYNFPSIEGYDPLYIERYGEFIRSANFGTYQIPERSVVKLSRRGFGTDRVLDLLGVSLIFHPIADTNQNWAYPVWGNPKRFNIVFQDSKFQIFKNKTAFNRTQLFYGYEVISDKQKEISRFYSKDFNFRNELLLEEKPAINFSKGKGSSQITLYTPNKVLIKTKTSTPALLFLSDNYYPGWKAKVNGREVKIYRADYAFRSVVVPTGESTVEFFFVPGF